MKHLDPEWEKLKPKIISWIHFIGTITMLVLLIVFAHMGRTTGFEDGYQEGLTKGFVRGIKCTNFAIQNKWDLKPAQEFGDGLQKCLNNLEEAR
jgi:hypothetical protein